MTEQECLKIICDVVRGDLENNNIQIDETMTSEDIPGWDSLAHTRIILNIGYRLGINLDIIETYELNNIGELVQLILRSKSL